MIKVDKKTKIAAGIIAGLVVAIIGVTTLINHLGDFSWTDKYGFTHNAESDATYAVDENKNRDYALVNLEDKYESLSGYDFLDKITSVLDAYSDKVYTTFLFDDGTGLYFPESDINNVAYYGVADENGLIVDPYKYVYISGTQIEIEDVSDMYSADSQSLMSLVPETYVDDSFFAATDEDNNAYFVVISTDDDAAMINELYGYATQVGCTNAYFQVIGKESDTGYIVTSDGIIQDNTAITVVNDFINNQN